MELRIEFGIFVRSLNFSLYNCSLQKFWYLLFVSFSSLVYWQFETNWKHFNAKKIYFNERSPEIILRCILNLQWNTKLCTWDERGAQLSGKVMEINKLDGCKLLSRWHCYNYNFQIRYSTRFSILPVWKIIAEILSVKSHYMPKRLIHVQF